MYVSAVDGQGNACSLINSIFSDFGSGMVVPGTGIVLHNRYRGAVRRWTRATATRWRRASGPYHTGVPVPGDRNHGWETAADRCAACMPQGHRLLISNMVHHGMDAAAGFQRLLKFMVGNDQALLEEGVLPDSCAP